MKTSNVEVLLAPVHIHAATKIEYIKHLGVLANYNFLANICDLPAGVLPVTSV